MWEIIETLEMLNLSYTTIHYGFYEVEQLKRKLANSKAVIFLFEHGTQRMAYQQMLATNTPILAWNKGGYWEDPSYYPHKVKFQPVSSVPYWNQGCGEKFTDFEDFDEKLNLFLKKLKQYTPEDYILENITLEKCAQLCVDIYEELAAECNA